MINPDAHDGDLLRKRRRSDAEEQRGTSAGGTGAASSSRPPSEQPGTTGAAKASPHSRASGEKRSRRGCQTCKTRRKKCPEDFAFRADGSYGCSTCFQKGLACGERGSGVGSGSAEGLHSLLQSSKLQRTGGVPSAGPSYWTATPPPALFAGSGTNANEPSRLTATVPTQLPTTAAANSAAIAPVDLTLDSSWLDDFFKEFSTLSDPIYQDAMWLANSSGTSAPSSRSAAPALAAQPAVATDTPSSPSSSSWHPPHDSNVTTTATSSAAPVASSSATSASAPVSSSSSSNNYDRIVQSDELDSLLERYSPLYEKLWRAAFSVSQPDNGLTQAILALSRASKSCRAATVASCLSYHHIMQRERAVTANPRNSMGLSHFLLSAESAHGGNGVSAGATTARHHAEGPEWHTAEDRVGMAFKWLQFAMDEYKRSGRQGTLEQRLATLLNLRWTIITLDGGNAGLFYMDEIRSLISQMGVTTGYMRRTARRGTVLTVLVLSALATDVFESATKRFQRCALKHSPQSLTTPATTVIVTPPSSSASPSTDHLNSEVLARDLQRGPLYEYEFTSCLSEGIIECIMLIGNLDADRHEGLLSGAEETQRAHEVESTIRACRFRAKADLQGAAMVRATALHEMWRQAVLIHYHQVIHQLGPLASKVQTCLQHILSLSNMVSAATLSPSETWDMWMVWFLSATVAVTAEQRAKCLRYLEALGSEQAVLDDIQVAKLVWKLTDETGCTQDWRVVAEKNGVGVCFAF